MTEVKTIPVAPIAERGYARPDVLVSTQWVADNLDNPHIRLMESNEDLLLYDSGHIPGAVKIDWVTQLNDPVTRDYLRQDQLQTLLRSMGVGQDTMIVLYGDKNNWWATYTLWVFRLFGLEKLKVMDGGRALWEKEGRPLTREVPRYPEGNIVTAPRDDVRYRAFREEVLAHVMAKKPLVDVRSPEEFRGERMHMPDYPNEGALRGGHIPGARSIPWGRAVNPDTHTFRPASELRTIYLEENGLKPADEIIAYCRIGERSSHSWFALTYLLGFDKVKNYDGSWTEWGNSVRMPIEKP